MAAELKKLGRYELRRVLGKGAMGVVYEGFDPTLGRRVAVKTILRNAAIDEETERAYAARFEREAKAVARLNHPHIVQVHDFGAENDIAFLVMEFIQGRELRSFFEAKETFGLAETVRIMGELLDALEFAHEAGVIHRDIKPANVMMDGQRRVKLTDFGVARVQDSDRSAAGTMVGTPAFMSPEQISGGKIDRRTDLFSAGTILYQLLTGEQPFTGDGAWTVAKKIMQDEPPQPSSLVKSVSPAYDAIVARALAKTPAQRYASAKEFAVALRAAAPGAAPAPGPSITMPKPKPKAAPAASEAEVEFWRSIQNSNDAAEFEVYLEQFPEGTYASLARIKMAKLRDAKAPDTQATVRLEAEERARKEAIEQARREAEEKAQREAEEQARRAAQAKAAAEARAKKVAEEIAQRQAAEKTKREAEERARQTAALARLKQEEAARKVSAVPVVGEQKKKSFLAPALIVAVVVVVGAGALIALSRKPVPAPVAEAPAPATAPAAPPRTEVTAADIEKIRKDTEERIRREYADRSAAEQAAAAKAASEKAIQEKQLAAKAATEKLAAEKAAAEKAVAEKAAAEKLAATKSAGEKATLEKLAAEKAAAEKAAAEKLAAEKAATEAAAVEKAAAEKAAAAKAAAAKPGWPSVGDRWVYDARDFHYPEKKYSMTVEVQAVAATGIRDAYQLPRSAGTSLTHGPGVRLTGIAEGVAEFAPYLRALQEPRPGVQWRPIEYQRLWDCASTVICDAWGHIVGRERVTVKAGSFDAWKVVIELSVRGMQRAGVATLTYWYAEEVKRTVKYQFRHNITLAATSQVSWLQPNMDMELVSYTPAK